MSPIQSLEVAGYAQESTYGTFVAPATFVPCIPNIQSQTKVVRPAQARGTRAQVVDAEVGFETMVTLTGEFIPEVFSGLICQWAGTASDTKTGSGGVGYTHAWVPKNALNSLSVEVDHDIASQVLARRITGCYVDQIIVRMPNQALATVEAQLLGQNESTPATPGLPSNPTPSISTIQPFDFSLLASTYKGSSTTQLMDVTLTLMNHVQRVFTNNSKLYVSRLVPTLREVQLSTTLDFLDTTFYNDWVVANKTAAAGMVLTLQSLTNITGASNPYQAQFTLGALRPQGAYTLAAASDVLNQQLAWSVTVGGADEIHGQIINGEAATLS